MVAGDRSVIGVDETVVVADVDADANGDGDSNWNPFSCSKTYLSLWSIFGRLFGVVHVSSIQINFILKFDH